MSESKIVEYRCPKCKLVFWRKVFMYTIAANKVKCVGCGEKAKIRSSNECTTKD